jgi:hypothetical protein
MKTVPGAVATGLTRLLPLAALVAAQIHKAHLIFERQPGKISLS